jgi:hypothetical protein
MQDAATAASRRRECFWRGASAIPHRCACASTRTRPRLLGGAYGVRREPSAIRGTGGGCSRCRVQAPTGRRRANVERVRPDRQVCDSVRAFRQASDASAAEPAVTTPRRRKEWPVNARPVPPAGQLTPTPTGRARAGRSPARPPLLHKRPVATRPRAGLASVPTGNTSGSCVGARTRVRSPWERLIPVERDQTLRGPVSFVSRRQALT